MKRRRLLQSALAMAAVPGSIGRAHAGDFPSRVIRIVVPYAPGGAADSLARAVGESMFQHLGQPVVIDNKPGASGTTGSLMVSRAAPDGYTLVMGTSASHSLNTVCLPGSYDPVRAFTPVALVTRVPNLVFVSRSLPVQNIEELIAYLKAHPGTGIAVGGPATSGRFAAELLMAKMQVQLTVVPYAGSTPATADVRAGHVPVGLTDLLSPMPFIRSGDLRPIALTGLNRASALPAVSTIAETVSPRFDAVAWNALFAPPGAPEPIVRKINKSVRKAFEDAGVRQKFEGLGQEIAISSPAELKRFMEEDIARWKAVAQTNKISF